MLYLTSSPLAYIGSKQAFVHVLNADGENVKQRRGDQNIAVDIPIIAAVEGLPRNFKHVINQG